MEALTRDKLMELYKSNFIEKYNHIYSYAVRHKNDRNFDRNLIENITYKREELTGQLELLAECGVDPQWMQRQEKTLDSTFDAYYLFGIVIGADGHVYGGDSAGKLQIKDKEAWREAEKRLERLNQVKAEAKERKYSVPTR